MLVYASQLIGTQILSMQAAAPVARVAGFVTDPTSLKTLAFILSGPLIDSTNCILTTRSVREYSEYGMVVDSEDEFMAEDDVIKVAEILKLDFNLAGLKVETKKGTKLGRVADFTVTSDDFTVQQLIVTRPLFKSFLDPELIIPRSEIVEITDYKVIVKDEEKTIRARASKEDFIPNFVNPFRKTEPSPAPARTKTPADKDTL